MDSNNKQNKQSAWPSQQYTRGLPVHATSTTSKHMENDSTHAIYRDFPISASFSAASTSINGFSNLTPPGYTQDKTVYRCLAVAKPPTAFSGMSQPSVGGFTGQDLFNNSSPFMNVGGKPALEHLMKNADLSDNKLQPKQFPFMLEKTSCYCYGKELQELVDTCDTILKDLNVDYSFNPEKCKYKGNAYALNERLDMRVYIYHNQDEDGSTYVVEFQRREGCAFHFRWIVQACVNALIKQSMVCTEEKKAVDSLPDHLKMNSKYSPTHGFTCPKATNDKYQAMNLTKESYQPLVQMANNPNYRDAQFQATKQLANLTAEEAPRSILKEMKELMQFFVGLISSRDAELCRCAVAAVCNLSKDESCHQILLEHQCIKPIMTLIVNESHELETRRLGVLSLTNLCNNSACVSEVVRQGAKSEIFSTLSNASDERLAKYASEARVALGVH